MRNWLLRAAKEAATGAGQGTERPAADTAEARPAAVPVCHVGLVFALGIEAGGLIDALRGVVSTEGHGFVAHEGGLAGRRLVLLQSGAGPAAATQGARALIDGHKPRWCISAGFAGALDDRLAKGDILMADKLLDINGRRLDVDLRIDRRSLELQPSVHVGSLLTVDRVIKDSSEKRALGQAHGALAVDMESLAVAEVCRQHQVRFLAVRVISDAVDRSLPREIDHLVKQKTTAGRIGAVAGAIFRRPSSIKDMWQLKEDALVASDRLAKFLMGVVRQLS